MRVTLEDIPDAATVIRREDLHSVLDRKGREVWWIAPTATVLEAIALMDEKRVGALTVVSNGALVGMISERDYARRVILKGRSSRDTLVHEIMTSPVITVTARHGLDECLRLMTDHRIRHLPVVEGQKLVGVVSIGDIAKAIILAQADTVHQLTNYIVGKYPA